MFEGILVSFLLALVSEFLSWFIPVPIDAIIYAIVIGLILGNVIKVPSTYQRGINFSAKRLLPLAVALMGMRLSLGQLGQVSLRGIDDAVIAVVVGIVIAWLLNKIIKLDSKSSTLIGFGTAFCGSSAIMAMSPLLESDTHQIGLSIATINLYGTIAMFVFPALAHLFGMHAVAYGIWSGAAIQSVPQVIAAGYVYGNLAGQTAITVKLIRVFLLAPALVLVSIIQSRRMQHQVDTRKPWYRYIPLMIVGFIVMATLNSLGWLNAIRSELIFISDFLIVMTLAAIGFNTQFRSLVAGGHKALLQGFLVMLAVAAATYFIA